VGSSASCAVTRPSRSRRAPDPDAADGRAGAYWDRRPDALNTSRRTRGALAHLLVGTDMLGRDIYSRVVYGARVSLVVGFSVAILSSIAGLRSACLRHGALGRWVHHAGDGRLDVDPPILLAVALMALTRGSVGNVVMAITIARYPRVSRLVRGVCCRCGEQPYVDAAVAAGNARADDYLAPYPANTLAPMTSAGDLHLRERHDSSRRSSRSSAPACRDHAVLGQHHGGGPRALAGQAIHCVLPAVFLSITVLAVNLLGDGMRDALDPRLAKGLEMAARVETSRPTSVHRTASTAPWMGVSSR